MIRENRNDSERAEEGALQIHQIAQALKTSRPTILKALENLQKRGIVTAIGKQETGDTD